MGRLGAADSDRTAAFRERAERRGLSWDQVVAVVSLVVAIVWGWMADAQATLSVVIFALQAGFLAAAGWRSLLMAASLKPTATASAPLRLPRYTVLAALVDEAAVLPQLVGRLSRLDYPADRLEGFLVLEVDDLETYEAALALDLPDWLSILRVPHGSPRTKPRALNVALGHATGDLLTVYDAEDDPDPLQLREAAARFAKDRARRIWALQAPLRTRIPSQSDSRFLDRQFAIEYASLFEVTLPGLARLGMPFPLGGTSNHFRIEALRAVGGWDAHNVTEDADLGFRLWRAGGRLDVISRPTHEPPPGGLEHWLPQRTRWLKGFMQTWGVHTRDVRGLGWRGGLSLLATLGTAIGAAAAHAVSMAWLVATVAIALAAGLAPETQIFAVTVLLTGAITAWVNAAIGCRRAGLSYTLADMLVAPAYWSLLSLAFAHAVWRLVREPFTWDKTVHFAEPSPDPPAGPADAGRRAG